MKKYIYGWIAILWSVQGSIAQVKPIFSQRVQGAFAPGSGAGPTFTQANGTGVIVGQDTTNQIITTAVPFLTITPDSRAAGMGDAGVATSADANSSYWNPAKLVFIEDRKSVV